MNPGNTHQCPSEVLKLVERFERHKDTYKQPTYNETNVRREFIDPFFTALDSNGEWSEDRAETGAGQPLPEDHELFANRQEIDQEMLANLLRMNVERAAAQ